MTIDEALSLVAGKPWCFVVWQADQIVSVKPFDNEPTSVEMIQHLQAMQSLGQLEGVPVRGRFLQETNATRETFAAECTEQHRIDARGAILNAWATEPPERTVERLEIGTYDYPMGGYVDIMFQINHLWRFHRKKLTGDLRFRLQKLIEQDEGFPGVQNGSWAQAVRFHLKAYLAALDGDSTTLLVMWRDPERQHGSWTMTNAVLEGLAYVGCADISVIEDVLQFIQMNAPFGLIRDAIRYLGWIGEAAGSRAVEIIKAKVFDSTPEIVAWRDRVIERIEMPDYAWKVCSACHFGWLTQHSGCPTCLGLGFVHIGDLSSVPDPSHRR